MAAAVPWEVPLGPATIAAVVKEAGLDDPARDVRDVRVLDYGCGNGRYLQALATVVPVENLQGLEVDPARVEQVRALGIACDVIVKGEPELRFADESFDVVFSSNVIEHIPRRDYLAVLREIRRVLRPGGRFVVGTPNYPAKRLYDMVKAVDPGPWRYYLFDDPTHCNKLGFGRLERDLRPLFAEVRLAPTYILGERRWRWLRRPAVRRRLRYLGDKIMGYCVKAAEGSSCAG